MNELPDKIVSIYHPVITKFYDGKKYVTYAEAGTWEVPEDFTQEDAMKRWVRYQPNIVEEKKVHTQPNVWEVPNSKGNGFYEVKYSSSYWVCSCPANTYKRKDCKHILKIKETIK